MVSLDNEQQATLGGGCFWCLEAIFQDINGITKVVSGYSGGNVENPTYEEVCSETTGHAEVVQITFNEEIITFEDILEVFFSIHDPTQLNRSGNDVGTQYRSIILYHSDQQREESEYMVYSLQSRLYTTPIVTEIKAFEVFYPAEHYHQNYFQNNPTQPYCNIVISPKLYKMRKQFDHLLRSRK